MLDGCQPPMPSLQHWANPAGHDPLGPGPESARPESGPGLLAPAAQGPPQLLWTTWSQDESKRGCCCGSGRARAAGHGPLMPPIGHMLGWARGRSQAVWALEQAHTPAPVPECCQTRVWQLVKRGYDGLARDAESSRTSARVGPVVRGEFDHRGGPCGWQRVRRRQPHCRKRP